MSNDQNKYDFLKEGDSAWFWHLKEKLPGLKRWEIIRVSCIPFQIQKTNSYLWNDGIYATTKDYPNGPKCLTPDEVKDLVNNYESELVELRAQLATLELLNREDDPDPKIYQDLEDWIMEDKTEDIENTDITIDREVLIDGISDAFNVSEGTARRAIRHILKRNNRGK
jgi:hypothetical protein